MTTATGVAGRAGVRPSSVPCHRAGKLLDARLLGAATALVDVTGVACAYVVATRVAPDPTGWVWATLPLWLVGLWSHRLYEPSRMASGDTEPARVFQAALVSGGLVVVGAFVVGIALPRSWALWAGAAGLVALEGGRALRRAAVRALARRGFVTHRTLVVGTNAEARSIARSLRRQRWLGFEPVGFVATEAGFGHSVDGLPVVGRTEGLLGAIDAVGASAVMVASSSVDAARLPALFRRLQAAKVDVRVTAGLGAVAASRVAVDPLDGVAVLSLRPAELSGAQAAVKRAVDIVGSLVLLVLTAPVMVAIAAAIRLTSGPGVLFRQQRVGRGGKPFTIYKFRTMVCDAEERLAGLIDLNDADGLLFKLVEDPRVTPIGARLRRWCLDELPQLFNVLRGDMSLVGPRPPLPSEAARYDEWVAGRLRVKPGITGLWQVNGRHELSFDDYVRYDLYYVENWSLALDLWILASTLPAVASGRGAW